VLSACSTVIVPFSIVLPTVAYPFDLFEGPRVGIPMIVLTPTSVVMAKPCDHQLVVALPAPPPAEATLALH